MGNFFSISLSGEDIRRCWNCVSGQANYSCNLQGNLVAMEQARDRLKDSRDDVKDKVRLAEQQPLMKRLSKVEGWLSRVETAIEEADLLIQDAPRQKEKLCLAGCFSKNCCSTYKFGKAVLQKLENLVSLQDEGDFKEVAERVPAAAQKNLRPIESSVGLESTFAQLWSCIEKEQSERIIGIYGMGGAGKTTLLTQIHNQLITMQKGFDIVIWVTVSKDYGIEKVQEEIREKMGISSNEFENKTLEKRAECIFNVLMGKKFVLLLDDIWERVDLVKVGIPFPKDENGSNLIFTTRFLSVCDKMTAQKKIKMKPLGPQEARELFVKNVGGETLDSHPDIPNLAEEVIKECDGLPLALITIGRAMACKKTPEAWKYAIDVLRTSASRSDFPGMGSEVYPKLKFSYDCLVNDTFRSCFLYCSLFPEDCRIGKEELIDYWVGEGFLDECGGQNRTRNHGHYIIDSLLGACLLEDAKYTGEGYVKMHDVIRDMAVWIACELKQEKWLVRTGAKLVDVPELEKWDKVERLSLMSNQIRNLTRTGVPICSQLRSLFLRSNRLSMISNDFFLIMPNLTVLDLSRNILLKKIPEEISTLVSLEYLNLSLTGITELPIEMKSLTKLRCLYLDKIMNLKRIPVEVISSFTKLQVLGMYSCGLPSEEQEWSIVCRDNECLIEELKRLRHLETLGITIKSDFALQKFLSFQNFQSCTQSMFLTGFQDSMSLDIGFLASMGCLREIAFDGLICLEEFKINVRTKNFPNKTCFNGLHRVQIVECSGLRELTWLLLAPNLSYLEVRWCQRLEAVILEEKLSQLQEAVAINLNDIFAKLEQVDLNSLEQLKSIYWHALPFPRLKDLCVVACPMLRKLPLNSESAKSHKITVRGAEKWLKELEWEDEATPKALNLVC